MFILADLVTLKPSFLVSIEHLLWGLLDIEKPSNEPLHEILVLIAYAQQLPINADTCALNGA